MGDATVDVKTLAAERTFWEKATILHSLFHQGPGKSVERKSRHYYDLAQMAKTPVCERALGNLGLLENVATHKSIFFESKPSRYDLAKPGTLRLMPDAELKKNLRQDYDDMQQMIFDEPPSFEKILEPIQELEARINKS